ncbi:hypothetical protein [Flavobacterium sp.]|jgi:hypothetical protein|uniref:hypothetical protein n=1 Tax=Flavobacterium sp. TaxID=239 RepID=UPI0037C00611
MDKLTTKQLIYKLIEHYQFGINNLPMEDWDEFLLKNDLFSGICSCAIEKFDVDIYKSDWIKILTNSEGIICGYPRFVPREKALEYLQIRLDALKRIDLKTLKNE